MRKYSTKTQFFILIKEIIIKKFNENNSVLGECALINIRRLYYLSIIAIPLRILNIYLFASSMESYDTPILKMWSQGIIASHSILLVFMVGFFLTTHKLKNRTDPNKTMYIIQYVAVIVIMASGTAIVSIDQLVTTNITPFLLICVICGLVFLIRPLISIIIYITSYVAYYYLIGLTIMNPQMLLSNRVNGITAVGLGLLLSIILWHYNYTNITQKRRIEMQKKQLERMAYYDSLTELPNRRLLNKLIKQEFSSIERHNHESVIIILDIDDFKNINDTYGHLSGDIVLKQLADILQNSVRESDTVSRFGGEEFIILMPNTTLAGGFAFAERLRKLIMEKSFSIGSDTLRITCSFGVSLLCETQGHNLEEYYSFADQALYWAKQHGKNRTEVCYGCGGNDF
ncbi:MAG: GGDEF domain-containing protein [Dehalobacterium sp.]|jgi:diguanylate cyclase (GGDEF)-like protein